MGNILSIARQDLRLVLQDRSAVMWMFVLPVVFATFFGLVMGGGGGAPADAQVRLTVVDRDGGFLARALLEDLASERLELVELTPSAAAETPDKVRTLVIPERFTADILRGEKTTLRLEREPDTNMEAALVAQARIVSAVARLIGRLVEVAGREGLELDEGTFGTTGRAEDLVSVSSRFAGQAKVTPSGFAQSIPGNVVMFVMLVALTYGAASVSEERSGGQLRRLATAPVSRSDIVLGKIGGRLVTSALQITVLMLVAVAANRLVGVYVGGDVLGMWVVLLVYAACVAPLGVMIGAWIRDPDRAASVGVLITMTMAAFGGCWWPLEFVPSYLQRVALALPTGWAMRALHQVVSFGRGIGDLTLELAALLGFAVAFGLIASRSLRVE
jgi:ABC-type multidrug transport system permease subunit